MPKLILYFFIFYLFISTNIFAKPSLTIYYFERPPFYFTDSDNKASGILIDITKNILDKANIKYTFISLPAKRVLSYLKTSTKACSPGWFFTDNRAKIFKYTLPIYRSLPIVAVINKKKWKKGVKSVSIDNLLKMNLSLALKSGFKYGEIIEKKLKKYPGKIKKYTIKTDNLLKMIVVGRIDYTFLSLENVTDFLSNNSYASGKLTVVYLNEIKKGKLRYLLCSKDVSDQIIERINKAIEQYKNEK